jgi:hypothetical protein
MRVHPLTTRGAGAGRHLVALFAKHASQLTAWIHIHHAVYFVSNYSLGIPLKLKQRSDSSIRHPLHAHMRRSSAGMNDTPMSLLPESQLTCKLGENKRNTTY